MSTNLLKSVAVSLLLMGSLCANAKQVNHLVIVSKDGAKMEYSLSQKPKITFTQTDIVLCVNNSYVSYALDQLLRFEYEKHEEAQEAIDLLTEKAVVEVQDNSLVFHGVEANTPVTIHAANGQTVVNRTVVSGGSYVLPVEHLASGVYMVSLGDKTYKIVKK